MSGRGGDGGPAQSGGRHAVTTPRAESHGSTLAHRSRSRAGWFSLAERARQYERRRPELTALYEVVRDNLETLYAASADGALDIKLPKHPKNELEAYLDCGLLCRGFARLRCGSCSESRLVGVQQ
jgi:hypothetical protein